MSIDLKDDNCIFKVDRELKKIGLRDSDQLLAAGRQPPGGYIGFSAALRFTMG